jgi:hypothetical protein
MYRIADRFVLYRYAELGVLATGAGLMSYGFAKHEDTVAGIGLGLSAHAVALLVLDYFAERRTHRYIDRLEAFTPTTSGALTHKSFGLQLSGAF